MATRFQGDRGLLVIPDVAGTPMDPSGYTPLDRSTAGDMRTQVVFDATIPVGVTFRERADAVAPEYADVDATALLSPLGMVAPTPWPVESPSAVSA